MIVTEAILSESGVDLVRRVVDVPLRSPIPDWWQPK